MKTVFLFVAVMLLSGITALFNAQVTSHSSNVANIDGSVDIADVNSVQNEMFGTTSKIKEVVSTDSISQRLNSIKLRLTVIEKKLGIEPEIDDKQKYVDLGLPSRTMWATCNVGANSPEEYGLYFAWGETTGYTSDTSDGRSFDWASYKWCNGSYKTMTKYCTYSSYGIVDNKTVLDASDDAATVNWGSDWCMPTDAQLTELRTCCTWTWETLNGVYGSKVTGTNGKYIFLPAAGHRTSSSFSDASFFGGYWSRSLTHSQYRAWNVWIDSDGVCRDGNDRRYGQSVRAVRVE